MPTGPKVLMLALALGCGVSQVVSQLAPVQPAQPPSTPEEACHELLKVRDFAFGPTGYGGGTSPGERAFHVIVASTNALRFLPGVLTNGNAQARLYVLCGIRRLAPQDFEAHAKWVIEASPRVQTLRGCIFREEWTADVVDRISKGVYDVHIQKPSP